LSIDRGLKVLGSHHAWRQGPHSGQNLVARIDLSVSIVVDEDQDPSGPTIVAACGECVRSADNHIPAAANSLPTSMLGYRHDVVYVGDRLAL
jgi:hypothetical protein